MISLRSIIEEIRRSVNRTLKCLSIDAPLISKEGYSYLNDPDKMRKFYRKIDRQ